MTADRLTIPARVAHHERSRLLVVAKALEDPESIVENPKADIHDFTLTLNRKAGTKRRQWERVVHRFGP